MATYKVIQDIEAEDKLLGPLTLKQFIYAAITATCLFFCYLSLVHHVQVLLILFVPVALAAAFFAFPWKLNQPTETWALAKIRFRVKSRQRIWDQSGIKDLVTITVPKKPAHIYTNGLSEDEVASRLSILANTIDSRGWAIKNSNINLSARQTPNDYEQTSDRLVGIANLPAQSTETVNNVTASNLDIQASDDILDEQNNPIAQNFNNLINDSNRTHRQAIVDNIKQVASGGPLPTASLPQVYGAVAQAGATAGSNPQSNDLWFMNQSSINPSQNNNSVTFDSQVVAPGSNASVLSVAPGDATAEAEEEALARKLRADNALPNLTYSHLHTIQPLSAQAQPSQAVSPPAAQAPASQQPPQPAIVNQPDPAAQAAIIDLASNDDLDVATIARQAQAKTRKVTDEVVISLH